MTLTFFSHKIFNLQEGKDLFMMKAYTYILLEFSFSVLMLLLLCSLCFIYYSDAWCTVTSVVVLMKYSHAELPACDKEPRDIAQGIDVLILLNIQ